MPVTIKCDVCFTDAFKLCCAFCKECKTAERIRENNFNTSGCHYEQIFQYDGYNNDMVARRMITNMDRKCRYFCFCGINVQRNVLFINFIYCSLSQQSVDYYRIVDKRNKNNTI